MFALCFFCCFVLVFHSGFCGCCLFLFSFVCFVVVFRLLLLLFVFFPHFCLAVVFADLRGRANRVIRFVKKSPKREDSSKDSMNLRLRKTCIKQTCA